MEHKSNQLRGVALALLVWCWVTLAEGSGRCRPKLYTHKALQTDLRGRRCWDSVRIQSCGGYCLSYEVTSTFTWLYRVGH